ncbi:unnamed protein product [Mycena citricolor]|uniref:RRM domain-containing protein n=1 Tax=Mycena citricolor TaxID=2018698 RepID=A0AAD2K2G3_9AGAR|nr:unnamed protein product [Mycena citricolor]
MPRCRGWSVHERGCLRLCTSLLALFHHFTVKYTYDRPPPFPTPSIGRPSLRTSAAAALPLRIPMSYAVPRPPPADESLLNKSLLDQLDAQADAEPVSSSASDDSSHDSPHPPFHTPTHTQDLQASKMAAYFPRASFTSFPNSTRAPGPRAPFRDQQPVNGPQYYPQQTEAFSPVLHPFDPRASFDFGGTAKPGAYPPLEFGSPPPSHQTAPKLNGYAAPYVNGSAGMHSQTPYGPHITSVSMGGINGAGIPPHSLANPPHEDICTIFVVGFPEDMQEREFQNMFTFSPGFEAATLKIPNKEYTAYGAQQQRALGGAGQYNGYAGSNDPYNLVTVNQGGVVVDGQNGITSWPAPPADEMGPQSGLSQAGSQGLSGNHFSGSVAPRKQIIGFAKFRTREEALGARDVLQGRRVDIDKGAVLKAEMAKKNLHTKRGVGPVGVGGSGLVINGMGSSLGMGVSNDIYDQLSPRDPLTLGMNGISPNAAAAFANGRMGWRSDDDDEPLMLHEERRQSVLNTLSLRARPDDDRPRLQDDSEAERLRRRDRDRRQGAFEAFAALRDENTGNHGPWDAVAGGIPGRRSTSPDTTPNTNNFYVNGGGPFAGEGPRALSSPPPSNEFGAPQYMGETQPTHRQERSQSSASEGSSDLERGMAKLGTTNAPISIPGSSNGSASGGSNGGSPQLASPASSGSLGRGVVDQNPPINTLYVGNLPVLPNASSGAAGFTMEYLEVALRDLFTQCAGFRQMSFRPKPNGPMCFVEFEDVNYATKTLNELYGNTLNGMIKGGGIRLSYSKNPLGVRTPTSANGAPVSLATQQGISEAAFHPRLTSPPPPTQEYGVASFSAPRFFAASTDGPWSRRWEAPRSAFSPFSNSPTVEGETTS